jgi:plasmid stabilization system protein ParE
MKGFVLTPAAEGDLLKIIEYLEGDNPDAVLSVVNALDEAMRRLADNPGIGHTRSDLTAESVRFWPVFKYLIIYRPGTQPLQILRVLQGRRDVKSILGD